MGDSPESVGELKAIIVALQAQFAAGGDAQQKIAALTAENAVLKTRLTELEAKNRKAAQLVFSMGSEPRRRQTVAPKKEKGFATMKRVSARSGEVTVLLAELAEWIGGILGLELVAEDLMEELALGVELCMLIKAIDPEAAKKQGKIHENAGPRSFLAHENVSNFVRSCSLITGRRIEDLFESSDIVCAAERRNERAVCHALLLLARVAHEKYAIAPPSLILLQKAIEKENMQQKETATANVSVAALNNDEKVQHDLIVTYCSTHALPPPQMVSKGRYMVSETVVPIRMVRHIPMLYIDDDWTPLADFSANNKSSSSNNSSGTSSSSISSSSSSNGSNGSSSNTSGGCSSCSSNGSSGSSSDGVSSNSGNSASSDSSNNAGVVADSSIGSAKPQENKKSVTFAEPDSKEEKQEEAEEETASPLPRDSVAEPRDSYRGGRGSRSESLSDDAKEICEKYRLSPHEYTAKKEFFFLTALAVKINHELREDIEVVSNTALFHKALSEGKDFFEFQGWIKTELTKMYLSAAAMAPKAGKGRQGRGRVMASISARHAEKPEGQALPR